MVNLLSRSEKVLGFSGMRCGAVPPPSFTPMTAHAQPVPILTTQGHLRPPPVSQVRAPALSWAPFPHPRAPRFPTLNLPSSSQRGAQGRPPLTKVAKLQCHVFVDLWEGRRRAHLGPQQTLTPTGTLALRRPLPWS